MDGDVKNGDYQGKRLSQLSLSELKAPFVFSQTHDDEAMRLLLAYARRVRASRWTSADEHETDIPYRGAPSSMSLSDARAILAVGVNAIKREIVEAHRSLMGRLHPDRGGSDYLAAQVNKAKDLLIKESHS